MSVCIFTVKWVSVTWKVLVLYFENMFARLTWSTTFSRGIQHVICLDYILNWSSSELGLGVKSNYHVSLQQLSLPWLIPTMPGRNFCWFLPLILILFTLPLSFLNPCTSCLLSWGFFHTDTACTFSIHLLSFFQPLFTQLVFFTRILIYPFHLVCYIILFQHIPQFQFWLCVFLQTHVMSRTRFLMRM